MNQTQEIARELETKYGCCAITPIGGTSIALDQEAVENLAKAHYKKMDISDVVYIVNIGGYIGESGAMCVRKPSLI